MAPGPEAAQCRSVLEECVGGDKVKDVDPPIINYLVRILEAQTNLDTRQVEKNVVTTIGTFLHACRCFPNITEANKAAEAMLENMDKKGWLPKVQEASTELKKPVQLGRIYERQLKESQRLGMGQPFVQNTTDVNTNDDLNWDEKRAHAKMERKRKKEEESKRATMQEYEGYLARRGISKNEEAVKIHGGAETRGNEDIRCMNIHINMGKQVLLNGTDLIINPKHRYGLVGRNGVGKTTLLRYLSEGELEGVSPYLQILHIEQEFHGDERTALQAILDTDVERTKLMQEEATLLASEGGSGVEVGQRLAEIYERMEEIDAHGAEARAGAILSGLSFTTEMMNKQTKKFSGGWRMRVALARALYISPDVLLLDEPTNHLDLHAVLWLEHTLRNWSKTLVVVSHSRSFLNAVATDIIHYHNMKLTYYKGNYDQFDQTRYETLKMQQRQHESQEKKRNHMQAFVDRWRYNASKAALAQSRLKMLEKMEFIPAVVEDPSFQFSFPEPEVVAPPYIQVVDVSFGFDAANPLFKDVNMGIDNDSRIALVGPNGSGKSTYLNVICGDLGCTDGRVVTNGKCRIARFTQHHMDVLTPQLTGLEFMQQSFPGVEIGQLRGQLGRFGLSGERQLQPIYTLSGGQKSRIAFAFITFRVPHLLLLDEPTNHLDIDTVEALIDALHTYKGGVLLISHDEHLINSVCDELWVCGEGNIVRYDGNFTAYKKLVVAEMMKKK